MATKKMADQTGELPEDQTEDDETDAQTEAPAPKRHGTSGTITVNAKGEVQ